MFIVFNVGFMFIVFNVGLQTPDPDLEILDDPPEEDIPTTKAGRVKFLVSVLFLCTIVANNYVAKLFT
jgi:hypothetical protein